MKKIYVCNDTITGIFSVQRERLLKSVLLGISSRKIAKEEGINYSSVDKSIAAAIKNFKKFYENL